MIENHLCGIPYFVFWNHADPMKFLVLLKPEYVPGQRLYLSGKLSTLEGLTGNGLRQQYIRILKAVLGSQILTEHHNLLFKGKALETTDIQFHRIGGLGITVDGKNGQAVGSGIVSGSGVHVRNPFLFHVLGSVVYGIARDVVGLTSGIYLQGGTLCVLHHLHEDVVGSGLPYMVMVGCTKCAKSSGHTSDFYAVCVTQERKLDGCHGKGL